jgi:ribosomal protein S18 acetylase RimI-like enzyme
MIKYSDNLNSISPAMLTGFFTGWYKKPSPEILFKILKNSEYKIIAIDDEKGNVAGFINAISDKILSAYIPLIEVLPQYHWRGIGKELVEKMIDKLKDHYMVDICIKAEHANFYSRYGMKNVSDMKSTSMIIRNYSKQDGKTLSEREN